jgi:hypothetical protein
LGEYVSNLTTSDKIFAGGYKSDIIGSKVGIKKTLYDQTLSEDYVIRGLAHSDGTSVPMIQVWDVNNSQELTKLVGTSTSNKTSPDNLIFTFELPTTEGYNVSNNCTDIEIKLINNASSGTVYWHQVEILSNAIDNPSFERGSGDPWVPDSWSNNSLISGESEAETTNINSGLQAVHFNVGEPICCWRGLRSSEISFTPGNFYSGGFQGMVLSGNGKLWFEQYRLRNHYEEIADHECTSDLDQIPPGSAYSFSGYVARCDRTSIPASIGVSMQYGSWEGYLDDFYLFPLENVSLTVIPSPQTNSYESTGLRIDGADTAIHPIKSLTSNQGKIMFNFTPRHNFSTAHLFGNIQPVIAEFYSNDNNTIKLVNYGNSTLTLEGKFNSTTVQANWTNATLDDYGVYYFEIIYENGKNLTLNVNDSQVATKSGVVKFNVTPNTSYWGSDHNGLNQYDGMFMNVTDGFYKYTSKIFDSQNPIGQWLNISWFNDTQEATENITISTKSCDDQFCSGESWNETHYNPLGSPINEQINRYFQYQVNFEPDGGDYGPNIYNISLSLLNTPPIFVTVSHTPITLAVLDPNTTIEVIANISDPDNNLDVSILQWKASNDSDWNNVTMSNLTAKNFYTTINGSFIPPIEANYSYRIISNDTYDVRLSNITNISVWWDCTWNITPTYLGETAGWDENKHIGNINIFNTGDPEHTNNNCNLDFRLNYDLTEGRIYFDNYYLKPSSTYTIPADNNRTIFINATFLSEVREETPIITVGELFDRSENSQRNVSAVIISTTGGPYLYQKISYYPDSLYLKEQDFSLSSYLRNVMGDGTVNNTAYNVSFYWTLPSGFTLKNGTSISLYQNISNNSFHYNNINVTFDSGNLPDLSPGTVNIYISSQGYNSTSDLIQHSQERTLLTEEANITLICYSEPDGIVVEECGSLDGDYAEENTTTLITTILPGGGGDSGSASGGLSYQQKQKLFQTQETYELVRGEEQNFILKVENPFDAILENISVTVSGFLGQYLRVDPASKRRIPIGDYTEFKVWIEAPKYFTKGKYDLNFTITGTLKRERQSGNQTIISVTNMEESRLITLIVHEISRETASKYFNQTILLIQDMRELGLNIEEVESLLSEAWINFQEKDYGKVQETHEKVKELKEEAVESLSIIEDLEGKVDNALYSGIKLPKTGRLILLAKSALGRGDYPTSLQRAQDAKVTYALERIGKFNIIYFVKNNLLEVTLSLIGLSILAQITYTFLRLAFINRRLTVLRKEEKVLLSLIKQIQRECFEENKIDVSEYFENLTQYEKRMTKVIQEIINLETTKLNLFKPFKKNDTRLIEEREKLLKLIKETQELYLTSKKIESRVYENRMRSYTERLTEIEETLSNIEAKKELKKLKWFWKWKK